MSETYDVIVIGAGPAGYVAAIRCAQLGLKTACVDDWKGMDGKPSLGGTCLNVGCIPSKALLDSSEQYYQLTHHFAQHGISAQNVKIDIATMLARKDKIVTTLTNGVKTLFDANKIITYHGRGRLVKPTQVEVSNASNTKVLEGTNIILATGSSPIDIPVAKVDQKSILDSTGALSLKDVPKHLGVIGAGVIGLELGSVWRRLGSQVTILEAVDQFLPAADRQIAQDAQRVFKQQGLEIQLGCQVTGSKVQKSGVQVDYKNKDSEQTITVDRLIVAVGRKPNTKNLIGPGINIRQDSRGFIEVDEQCRTAISNIYAIGDSVRGPMLAHKGSEEGVMVAELIAGQSGHINYNVIPWVIYTWPEIAWTGRTEQQLKQDGIEYKVGMFPMGANGRALAMGETNGRIKILAAADDDEVLGIHAIGAYASELIAEAVVAMEFSAASEDIARIVHAHPTLSESTHEAALAVNKRAIHRVN